MILAWGQLTLHAPAKGHLGHSFDGHTGQLKAKEGQFGSFSLFLLLLLGLDAGELWVECLLFGAIGLWTVRRCIFEVFRKKRKIVNSVSFR